MRIGSALGLAIAPVLCIAPCALAAAPAEKPAFEPAPAWVKPLPALSVAGKMTEAAVNLLLSDQQIAFEPGRQTTYQRTALRIQTAQGLAAGSISLPWRPEVDTLTIHGLVIRRGDEVIDVLASGQTFTIVRREANLEHAMLDGVLTATIQPEGLAVGDTIDFAISVSTSDPVLKGHVEQVGAGWNGLPIARAHFRALWPSTMPIRLRASAGLPAFKPATNGAITSIELSASDVQPLNPPRGAPMRFHMGRFVELSAFRSWAELAVLEAPLYAQASILPALGPLQAEVARIRALSADPKIRSAAALALVQDRVRYVALLMGQGGMVPASASETWARRFGDCKGKTALLLGLLRALDVEAEPVLVNAIGGDGMNERLPMVGLFNHVIVRATIAGRAYWMDGTRTGDKRLDALPVPAFGWGLPVRSQGATLERILPPPLAESTQTTAIRIDATAGLSVPAPTSIEVLTRGDEALGLNMSLANLTADARDRALRDYWREKYDFIDVKSTTARFDATTGEHRMVMDGAARMEWRKGFYETDGTDIGYKADFRRDPGPNSDAPFAVAHPSYTRTVETILLPPGRFAAYEGAEVDRTIAGVAYRRRASVVGNVFTVEKTERSIVSEFSAADAPAAQIALRVLAEKRVHVQVLPGYRPQEKEVAAIIAAKPTTADGFLARGNLFIDLRRYDEAIADFNSALALNPKNVWALANRGISHVWKDDAAAAEKDLAAAEAIDLRNAVVFRARGLLAERRQVWPEAVTAYTTSLDIDPGHPFALGHRALVHRAAGDDAAALLDSAAALKLDPAWIDLSLMRANLFRASGREADAIAEAEKIVADNPDNGYAHVAAARIYGAYKRQADAMRAYDRAIAIKPEPYILVNRSQTRLKTDYAGRRADLDAASQLDPQDMNVAEARAALQQEEGDHAGALRSWTAALSRHPDDTTLLVGRGLVRARLGDTALAEKDFAAARTAAEAGKGTNGDAADSFNSMCWAKAMSGLALLSGLADCDAALAEKPDFLPAIDSRGLVLMRLGRFDEAMSAYDRVLAKQPGWASSRYGRAVTWARKGDRAKSDADAALALKTDPDIEADWRAFGVVR